MRRIRTLLTIIVLFSTGALGDEPLLPHLYDPRALIEHSAVVVDATLGDVSFDREIGKARNDWSTLDVVHYSAVLEVHTVLAGGAIGHAQIPLNWQVDETVVISAPQADFSSLSGDRAIWLLSYRDGELVPTGWTSVWTLDGVSWHSFWSARSVLDQLNRRENPPLNDQVDMIRRYIADYVLQQASMEERSN